MPRFKAISHSSYLRRSECDCADAINL